MKETVLRFRKNIVNGRKSGMELVQVAILIAIAIALGLIFKNQLTSFVNGVFKSLNSADF